MTCPLCNNETFTKSWFGKTYFNDKVFDYAECLKCKSLYCQPMPDGDTLAKLYGMDYFDMEPGEKSCADIHNDPAARFDETLAWLKSQKPGLLLDYGCGDGSLLEKARELGWEIVGLDFDPEVTKQVSRRLGAKVVSDVFDLGENFQADVLHLGDVFEHLTDVNRQVPEILSLLKPNGILLASGPLEANSNLFTYILKKSRRLRNKNVSEIPPYHVMLATAQGQREFFRRFKLQEIKFKITEVAHPAPETVSFSDFSNPNKVGLFAVRRLSQMVTAMNSDNWGNRYFYIGRNLDV